MTRAQVLKQYPESEPWKRAAFLLYHFDMLLFNERMAIAELLTMHRVPNACLDLINAAFIRNMRLIKGVSLCELSHAMPQDRQSPEQELTL